MKLQKFSKPSSKTSKASTVDGGFIGLSVKRNSASLKLLSSFRIREAKEQNKNL